MPKTLILGTAGHIDHGKTSLVKALTGIDTDRLKEEKERGITIELGFAHLELPGDIRVGIVDVPGHEKFVRHMVAGVTGMDMVCLVIAADEGIMPQTREHLDILQLLRVKKGLVALTKIDLVDREWLELVEMEIREKLTGTFLENAPIVKVSTKTGEGLEELKEEILKLSKECPQRDSHGPFRLPIDRVFTVKGFGTVVTGTSISGVIRVGDPVEIMPKRIQSRVRTLQNHGVDAQESYPGSRTAICLQGVEKDMVERGDVVTSPNSLAPTLLIDVELTYLKSCLKNLKNRAIVRFHVGTVEVIAKVFFQKDELEPGEKTFAQIRLEKPIAVLRGDPFILRSFSPVHTIGGGVILNPLAKKRKKTKPEHWQEFLILSSNEPEDIINYHLLNAGIKGLSQGELSIRTSYFGKKLEKYLQRPLSTGNILSFQLEPTRYVHKKCYDDALGKIINTLEEFHKTNPYQKGISKEELKSKAFPYNVDNKVYLRLLSDLEKQDKIKIDRETISLKSHEISLDTNLEEIKKKMESILLSSGYETPTKEELFKNFQNESTASQVFEILKKEGTIVILKDSIIYHKDTIKSILDSVMEWFKKNKELTVGDFKSILGVSRKYAIPLLEYLDNKKITLRVGDKRIARQQAIKESQNP